MKVSDQRIPRVHGSRCHEVEVTANGKHQMMRYQQAYSGQQNVRMNNVEASSFSITMYFLTVRHTTDPRVYLDGSKDKAR